MSSLNLDLVDQNIKVHTTHTAVFGGVEIITNKNPIINKVVLIVGDLYRTLFAPWLANVYKQVIYLHRDVYTPKILEQYHADVVILEAVERYVTVNAEFQL